MLRKLSLAAVGCLALVALVIPSTAAAVDPGCNGNNLATGIYNDALELGKFDLFFSPTTKGANAEVTTASGANLCGTNPAGNSFYETGTIAYPNVPIASAPTARCAAGNAFVTYCNAKGPGNTLLADHRYTGEATSDLYCPDTVCDIVGNQINNVVSKTTIRYNTGLRNNGTNRCLNTTGYKVISCFETEASLLGYSCDADIIISVSATGNHPLKMEIYRPTCETKIFITPHAYFDNIDSLKICQYAGAVDGSACGTNPVDWLTKNGTVTNYTYTVTGHTTNLGDQVGTATGQWT